MKHLWCNEWIKARILCVASFQEATSFSISSYNFGADDPVDTMNSGYISLATTTLKLQQMLMILEIPTRVWGHRLYQQTSEQ